MNLSLINQELDLIRSILSGYPPSIARADAMHSLRVIQAETQCSPISPEPYTNPIGYERFRRARRLQPLPTKGVL